MDVPFKMIDPNQRFIQPKRKRLCISDAHKQRARQAWPFGNRHGIKIGEADACALHRLTNDWHDVAKMLTGSKLRNHTAIVGMERHLRGHNVRKRLASST